MKKVLTAKDSQAFNNNFDVFNPFDLLDLILLNVIGLEIFFLLRGGNEIVMLLKNSIIRDTFVKGHPLEGTPYFSLRLFDKTHRLSLHQAYIRDMQDIL